MNRTSNQLQTSNSNTFNSKSSGYKMLRAASAGRLDVIQNLFAVLSSQEIQQALALQRVSVESEERYPPLSYAVSNNHMSVVASLSNHGANWELKAQKVNGQGLTSIEYLNKKEEGLCDLLKSYSDLKEPIVFSHLFHLLASPTLSVELKQKVLKDRNLRESILKTFLPAEAACIFALCATGSFVWKENGSQAYGQHCSKEVFDNYALKDQMNCRSFVTYIQQLCNLYPNNIEEHVQKSLTTQEKANANTYLKSFKEGDLTAAHHLQRLSVRKVSQTLGCKFDVAATVPMILKPCTETTVQWLFMENSRGFLAHTAMLVKGDFGIYILHLDGHTSHVVCEDAKQVLNYYLQERDIRKMYLN